MKELIENPEPSFPSTPIRTNNQLSSLDSKPQIRRWLRSEDKHYQRRSPQPIVLESPILNRSNRFLKICRNKAFSLHRGSLNPFEMTFYPQKNGALPEL